MEQVKWGRTGSMGPDHAHWPAQPEAAHAASELHDDDDGSDGAVVVTALGAALMTLLGFGVAALLWSVW